LGARETEYFPPHARVLVDFSIEQPPLTLQRRKTFKKPPAKKIFPGEKPQ
jgi:hypothetical protein